MTSQRPADREFLQSLGEEFRLTLPQKIGQIEQHWARLRELGLPTETTASPSSRHRRPARDGRNGGAQDTDGADVLYELTRMLHTLAGSAPMFGFTDMGEAARRAEDALTSRGDSELADLMIEVLSMMSEHLVEGSVH